MKFIKCLIFSLFFVVAGTNYVEAKVRDVISIAEKSYFIDDDDRLWASGLEAYIDNMKPDYVGVSGEKYLTTPKVIAEDVRKFDFVADTQLILKNDGTLLTYGGSDEVTYSLGQGEVKENYTPTVVLTEVKDADVLPGGLSVVALREDNSLWAWGNVWSVMGNNSKNPIGEPTFVMSDIEEMFEAYGVLYLHKSDDTWLACGYGEENQPPTELNFNFEPQSIWWSGDFTLALDKENNLWAWKNYTEATECTPFMVESDVKSAEAVADSLKTDKAFIVLKNDGTLWLTDTNKKEKIADNLKGFRYYKYYYGSDTNVRNEYMYLDYNGELFFMPDYKSGKREIIMEDVKNFASDKFDYWSQHMFVEKNDESLWVMGYNYGSLGMGKAGRDVKIPSQNLYNVESVETTTEITDINLDELHKEEIPLRGALLALTVVVLGGIILWIAKRR